MFDSAINFGPKHRMHAVIDLEAEHLLTRAAVMKAGVDVTRQYRRALSRLASMARRAEFFGAHKSRSGSVR